MTMKTNYICPKKLYKTEYPDFSDRLKVVMELRECGVSDLAEKIYTSSATVSMYRNGERLPSLQVLRLIAIELQVSTDFLLGLSDFILI